MKVHAWKHGCTPNSVYPSARAYHWVDTRCGLRTDARSTVDSRKYKEEITCKSCKRGIKYEVC